MRAADVFGATVYASVPGPVRVPDGTVIHAGTPVADQAHPAAVVTDIVPVRPPAAAVIVPGVTVYVHDVPD